jgi:putative flippase GtrA
MKILKRVLKFLALLLSGIIIGIGMYAIMLSENPLLTLAYVYIAIIGILCAVIVLGFLIGGLWRLSE